MPAPAIRGAWQRIRGAGWSILETPVAAGLAWYIAHTLLGHHEPFFAPTAQSGGPHAQLIARLAEACAGDTLRLTARTPIGQPDSARIYN